jgi:hypothetical protein
VWKIGFAAGMPAHRRTRRATVFHRQYRRSEIREQLAASPTRERQIEKRHSNHKLAGTHDFPKLVERDCWD